MAYSLEYLAGFFDADGCVLIVQDKKAKYKSGLRYYVGVSVTQKVPTILYEYQRRWGGGVYYNPSARVWSWKRDARKAVKCMQELIPYLHLKCWEARIALIFQAHIHKGPQRNLAFQQRCYHLMKQCKVRRRKCPTT